MTYRPVNLGPQEISSDPPTVPHELAPASQVDWPKTHADEFWAYMIERHRSHGDWWKGPDDCHHPHCIALTGWYFKLEARR